PESTPSPVPEAANVAQPAAPSRPKASFQADRASAEHQARSKMLWGDPPEDVTKYLMMQGFSVEEASACSAALLHERVVMVRGIGVRKILCGIGLMCVPVAAYLVMH